MLQPGASFPQVKTSDDISLKQVILFCSKMERGDASPLNRMILFLLQIKAQLLAMCFTTNICNIFFSSVFHHDKKWFQKLASINHTFKSFSERSSFVVLILSTYLDYFQGNKDKLRTYNFRCIFIQIIEKFRREITCLLLFSIDQDHSQKSLQQLVHLTYINIYIYINDQLLTRYEHSVISHIPTQQRAL